MATRSTIAIHREDGTVAQVYCHWDGYLDHNGAILVNHYTDPAKIEALIALGDISSLGNVVGEQHPFDTYNKDKLSAEELELAERADKEDWTKFYGRDRGEEGTQARVFANIESYEKSAQFEEYDYFFIEGRWYYKSYDGLVRDVEKQLIWERLNKEEKAA
jgi:hypothetical protein